MDTSAAAVLLNFEDLIEDHDYTEHGLHVNTVNHSIIRQCLEDGREERGEKMREERREER